MHLRMHFQKEMHCCKFTSPNRSELNEIKNPSQPFESENNEPPEKKEVDYLPASDFVSADPISLTNVIDESSLTNAIKEPVSLSYTVEQSIYSDQDSSQLSVFKVDSIIQNPLLPPAPIVNTKIRNQSQQIAEVINKDSILKFAAAAKEMAENAFSLNERIREFHSQPSKRLPHAARVVLHSIRQNPDLAAKLQFDFQRWKEYSEELSEDHRGFLTDEDVRSGVDEIIEKHLEEIRSVQEEINEDDQALEALKTSISEIKQLIEKGHAIMSEKNSAVQKVNLHKSNKVHYRGLLEQIVENLRIVAFTFETDANNKTSISVASRLFDNAIESLVKCSESEKSNLLLNEKTIVNPYSEENTALTVDPSNSTENIAGDKDDKSPLNENLLQQRTMKAPQKTITLHNSAIRILYKLIFTPDPQILLEDPKKIKDLLGTSVASINAMETYLQEEWFPAGVVKEHRKEILREIFPYFVSWDCKKRFRVRVQNSSTTVECLPGFVPVNLQEALMTNSTDSAAGTRESYSLLVKQFDRAVQNLWTNTKEGQMTFKKLTDIVEDKLSFEKSVIVINMRTMATRKSDIQSFLSNAKDYLGNHLSFYPLPVIVPSMSQSNSLSLEIPAEIGRSSTAKVASENLDFDDDDSSTDFLTEEELNEQIAYLKAKRKRQQMEARKKQK